MNILEGNLINLRAPEPEDLELLYRWENNSDTWLVSSTITPFSKFTLKQYIESHSDIFESHQLRLMIDKKSFTDQKTVGTIDLFDFDAYHHRAGIGILIGEPVNRGNGYANDALQVLVKYAFSFLKLHQLYCNITSDNEISLNLFTKNGFEIIGLKKDWIASFNGYIDEYLLQLINKQEHQSRV